MDDLETWKTRAEQAETVLRQVRVGLDGTAEDWLPALALHRMTQRNSAQAAFADEEQKRMAADQSARAWRDAWETKHDVLLAEEQRRLNVMVELRDLQRSIASALFGAARDDERCPPEKIDGGMMDSLGAYLNAGAMPATLLECAESFLREEEKRHG